MAILLIVMIVVIFIYLSFKLYLTHIVETYLQNTQTKHLEPLGVDETAFIGLHKKELELKDAYMIYARKTTAYKGVILFSPDWQLNYRFYMPLINFLCRQGYIITTYKQNHAFYSQSIKDLETLYQYVVKDEVLGTYPLSCLGHGTGALVQLGLPMEKILHTIAFQPATIEIEEIFKLSRYKQPFVKQQLIQFIQKKYGCNVALQPHSTSSTYLIYGDEGDKDCVKLEDASIKILNGFGHYPFLNMDSEQRIKSLECLLAYPETPQFEYNKAIETFDTQVLYDLNQDVLNILPYLFEYQDSQQ